MPQHTLPSLGRRTRASGDGKVIVSVSHSLVVDWHPWQKGCSLSCVDVCVLWGFYVDSKTKPKTVNHNKALFSRVQGCYGNYDQQHWLVLH